MHRNPERPAALQQRVAQAAQAPAHPPRPEALLDVRRHRQHRRGAARVRARVGGVPVQPHAQPRVRQELLAEPAHRQPRGDHAQVAQAGAEPREVAGAQGPVQDRLADEVPQPGGTVVQRLPRRTGPGTERGVERGRDGRRVERQVQPGAVGEPVAADRIDRLDLQVGGTAGGGEQVGEHLRQGEQRRSRVEGEPVAAVLPQLPAVGRGALVHRHPVALRREPGGGGQAADPGPDHDDARHVSSPSSAPRHARPRRARTPGQPSTLPRQLAPPVAAPRRREQPEQRRHRDRVGQRVGPRAPAAVGGGQHPAHHRGGVADQPGPGPAQGRQGRHQVGQRQRARDGRRRRGGPERGPERLAVPGPQVRPAVVHAARGQVGAVGHPDPPAGALDRTGHREVVEHLRGDPGEPACPRQRGGVDDEELAVGGAQGRPRGPLGPAQRQGHHPRPLQQRLHQPGGAVGELARPRREQVEPGAAQHRDRGRDGVRRQRHVGVDEHQHAPAGRGRELARRRAACPGGRAGVGVPRRSRTRGSPPATRRTTSAGAVRRAVVQDEQLEVGDTALGQQRRQGRTDAVRLVADRQRDGHRLGHERGVDGGPAQPPEVDRLVQRAEHRERRPRAHEHTRRSGGHHGEPGWRCGTRRRARHAGRRRIRQDRGIPASLDRSAGPAPHRHAPVRPEDPDVPSHRRPAAPRGARRTPRRSAAGAPAAAVGAGRCDGARPDRLPAGGRRGAHRDHRGLGARVLRGLGVRRRARARAAGGRRAARRRGRGWPARRGRRRAHRRPVRRLRLHRRPRRRRCSACPRSCRWPGR